MTICCRGLAFVGRWIFEEIDGLLVWGFVENNEMKQEKTRERIKTLGSRCCVVRCWCIPKLYRAPLTNRFLAHHSSKKLDWIISVAVTSATSSSLHRRWNSKLPEGGFGL